MFVLPGCSLGVGVFLCHPSHCFSAANLAGFGVYRQQFREFWVLGLAIVLLQLLLFSGTVLPLCCPEGLRSELRFGVFRDFGTVLPPPVPQAWSPKIVGFSPQYEL